MGFYTKLPVVIEAHHWDGTPECATAIIDWILDHGHTARYHGMHEMVIDTLEGQMTVSRGDWVIRGVKGEFYPCKPDIFAETYQPESIKAEVTYG